MQINICFSCLFITYKGEWVFPSFNVSNPTAFNNDMLILSTVFSAASILWGTFQGIRSICSIRKRLHEKKTQKNQTDIPLEEVLLHTTEEQFQNNLPQLEAITDLSEVGDIERIICTLPGGTAVEITPDQILEYICN